MKILKIFWRYDNIKLLNKCKAIEWIYNYWIITKFLNEYKIIEAKLTNWIRLILILNKNKNFGVKEILLN